MCWGEDWRRREKEQGARDLGCTVRGGRATSPDSHSRDTRPSVQVCPGILRCVTPREEVRVAVWGGVSTTMELPGVQQRDVWELGGLHYDGCVSGEDSALGGKRLVPSNRPVECGA